ncbi:MAG: MBL fold metallo-hydrolase [Halanaerobiales bacterium]
MKIYHLYHSGVAVEYKQRLLVFDYYDNNPVGKDRNLSGGVINPENLSKYKEIDVFVSHRHGDHYNPIIFNWREKNNNIKYFLSNDIGKAEKGDNVFYLGQDQELSTDDMQIKTFGSTDLGISFLVEINGSSIFHAGDLNWWCWKSFSERELKREERDYKNEISKLKGEKIDIAFVPVDPRLDKYYYLAGSYFIEEIKPELFIPIHFGNRYGITKKFADKMNSCGCRVAVIEKRGDMIKF